MKEIRIPWQKAMGLAIVCGLMLSLGMLVGTLHAADSKLLGGAKGMVRSAKREPLEGIMVQLVSSKTAIRTTVYSNEEGRYEFPKLEAGMYTLRIARPMEFKPYQRDSVRVDGTTQLEDITLERVTDSEFLPPTPEILAQLTGAEWLLNIPGTGQEKKLFSRACGLGCHSYQQIFRNRYDEKSWTLIVNRMVAYLRAGLLEPMTPERRRETSEEEELLVKWLSRVRGPESKDTPLQALPGPSGAATRVIVTEYELPRLMIAPHDIAADAEGNIWYTPHRSPYVGKLDPKTGVVTEYLVPPFPSPSSPTGHAHPGTHFIDVDKNGIVWMSEPQWDQKEGKFIGLDPKTGEVTRIDRGGCAVAPDGTLWSTGQSITQRDQTGRVLQQWPGARGTYNCTMSKDGNFIGGGSWPTDYTVYFDIRAGKPYVQETRTKKSNPARGGFDPQGNLWIGARGGMIIKVDAKTHRLSEYWPPTPYVTFYEAIADQRNGEVWAAAQHGGRVLRFNPRTEKWIEYVLPEPYSHNRRAWIDNSTDPVTFWYVDHIGYMVRVQPLE